MKNKSKAKILVVFYSRSGNTKKIGKEISKNLNAEIDEIIDLKDRNRIITGWIIAGKDASTKKLTKIKYIEDPSKYDLVVIGTPVWAWTVTPAIRTYLTENKFKEVAFFCTCGGQKGKTFTEMETLSKKPINALEIKDKEVGNSKDDVKKFCQTLVW